MLSGSSQLQNKPQLSPASPPPPFTNPIMRIIVSMKLDSDVLDHPEDNFLLLSDAFHPAIYQLDIATEVPRILPLPPDQQPTAVIMDRQNQTLYWSDVANSVIHRRSMDQNTSEIFLQLPKGLVLIYLSTSINLSLIKLIQ